MKKINLENDIVLIQGAAGFVAKSLIPKVIEEINFYELLLVDSKPFSLNKIDCVSKNDKKIKIIENNSIANIIFDHNPNLIISLAGETNVDEALFDPFSAFSKNISIVINLCEWIRTISPKTKLIYISSDEVFGESFIPKNEHSPLNPTQPYAASKAASEIIINTYRNVYNLNIITLRSCNLIGKNIRNRKLLSVIACSIKKGIPTTIYGNGDAKREWLDVDDFCEAIFCLIRKRKVKGTYNATSGIRLSVNEIIKIIENNLSISIEKEFVEDRRVHDQCYSTDSTALRNIGWKPKKDPKYSIINSVLHMVDNVSIEEFNW